MPMELYSQWPEMWCPSDYNASTNQDCYGNPVTQNAPKVDTNDGQWHTYVVRIKANTVGQHDGLQEMWIDGKKVVAQSNLRWRDTTDVGDLLADQPFGDLADHPLRGDAEELVAALLAGAGADDLVDERVVIEHAHELRDALVGVGHVGVGPHDDRAAGHRLPMRRTVPAPPLRWNATTLRLGYIGSAS